MLSVPLLFTILVATEVNIYANKEKQLENKGFIKQPVCSIYEGMLCNI